MSDSPIYDALSHGLDPEDVPGAPDDTPAPAPAALEPTAAPEAADAPVTLRDPADLPNDAPEADDPGMPAPTPPDAAPDPAPEPVYPTPPPEPVPAADLHAAGLDPDAILTGPPPEGEPVDRDAVLAELHAEWLANHADQYDHRPVPAATLPRDPGPTEETPQ